MTRGRAGQRGGLARVVLLSCGLVGLLSTVGGLESARAQTEEGGPRRVAVLGLDAIDLPARLATQATEAVRAQVSARPDLLLVARDAVSLGEAALTFSCIDEQPACLAQVGKELGAQLLLYGRLRAYREQAHLVLQAIDVEHETLAGSVDSIVELGLVEDGAARLAGQLLGDGADGAQGRIILDVMQAGARIYLDDRLIDQAPLAMPVLVGPGAHRLRIVHENFLEDNRVVAAQAGETVNLSINLRPLPEDLPAAAPLTGAERPVSRRLAATPPARSGLRVSTARLVGWGLLGGGVLVAATGGVFGMLTVQAQDEYDSLSWQRRSKELADTGENYALTANVLYATGGALALSGAILLLTAGGASRGSGGDVDQEQGPQLQPWLVPGPRGSQSLGASLRFALP